MSDVHKKVKSLLEGDITDTQLCCNSIESFLPELHSYIYKAKPTDICTTIHSALSKILKLWSQDKPNTKNKWCRCIVGLSTAMASALPAAPQGTLAKYCKLLTFTLAKATSIVEGRGLLQLVEACAQCAGSVCDRPDCESNTWKMIQVLVSLIAGLPRVLKSSPRGASKADMECVGRCIQVSLTENIMSKVCADTVSGAAIRAHTLDAASTWCAMADMSDGDVGMSRAVRVQLFAALSPDFSSRIVGDTLETITHQMVTLVKSGRTDQLKLLCSQTVEFLSSLAENVKSRNSDSCESVSQSSLTARMALYWAYELKSRAISGALKGTGCADTGWRIACDFVRMWCTRHAMHQTTWQWELVKLILEYENHDISTDTHHRDVNSVLTIPYAELRTADKTLISKLCVSVMVTESSEFETSPSGANAPISNGFRVIIEQFVKSDNEGSGSATVCGDFATKLLASCFLKASSCDMHPVVVVQLLSLSMTAFSACLSWEYLDTSWSETMFKYFISGLTKFVGDSDKSLRNEWNIALSESAFSFISSVATLVGSTEKTGQMDETKRLQCREALGCVIYSMLTQLVTLWLKNECVDEAASLLHFSLPLCCELSAPPESQQRLSKLYSRCMIEYASRHLSDGNCPQLLVARVHVSSLKECRSILPSETFLSDVFEELCTSLQEHHRTCDSEIIERTVQFITDLFESYSFVPDSDVYIFRLTALSTCMWEGKSGDIYDRYHQAVKDLEHFLIPSRTNTEATEYVESVLKKFSLSVRQRCQCCVLLLRWKFAQYEDTSDNPTIQSLLFSTLELWRDSFSEPTTIGSFNAVPDTYQLFSHLGIQGCVDAQICMLQNLAGKLESCSSDEIGRKKWEHLVLHMKCTLLMTCASSGVRNHEDRVREITGDHSEWSRSVYKLYDIGTELLALVDSCSIEATLESKYSVFSSVAEKVFKELRMLKLHILSYWVCLYSSKICLWVLGSHSQALVWAKCALNAKGPGSSHTASVDSSPLLLDTYLHVADLLEMSGAFEKCLSYLAEAKALGQAIPGVYRNICSLHTLRVLHRSESAKLSTELENLCSLTHKGVKGIITLDIDNLIEAAARSLEKLIVNGSVDCASVDALNYRRLFYYWDLTPYRVDLGATEVATLQYNTCLPKPIRAFVAESLKRKLCELSDMYHSSHVFSGFSGVNNSIINERISRAFSGKSILAGECFDVVRDMRRRAAVDVLLPSLSIYTSGTALASEDRLCESLGKCFAQSLLSFVLGAGSCGTTVECSLEFKSDSSSERNAHLNTACELVRSACCGNTSSLLAINGMLDAWNGASNQKCDVCSTCFISLDHSSHRILLGRKDLSSFPLVVAIPKYDALLAALKEWDDIIEVNKSQLQSTSSADVIKNWTDSDKLKWWHGRENLDMRMAKFLEQVQDILGVWRCILSPPLQLDQCTFDDKENAVREVFQDLIDSRTLCTSGRTRGGKGKAKSSKKLQFTCKTSDTNDIINGILVWVRFITSEIAGLDKCDCVTAVSEVLMCAMGYVLDGAEMSEEISRKILQRAIEVVDLIRPDVITELSRTESQASNEYCASKEVDESAIRERVGRMKVVELRQELKDAGLETSGKKADLVERLCQALILTASRTATGEDGASKVEVTSDDTHNNKQTEKLEIEDSNQVGHVVLILDEAMQALPWETLPCLRKHSCSRVPGLAVLLNLLLLHGRSDSESVVAAPSKTSGHVESSKKNSLISLARCWYAVDPDDNLHRTRSTMMTFLEPYATKWRWRGYVGERPPDDMIRENHESSELFLYCGHGSGEKLFGKSNKLRKLRCPAAMLWGCSSGALIKNGIHDPYGASVSYLLSGAPWVVGNLWDVTDKDIDKLSVQCMENLFNEESNRKFGNSISQSLSYSRNVCKMKSAVGSAPVVYGLPVGVNPVS